MGRGMITDEIRKLFKDKCFVELDTVGLRLMPYIQYRLINHGNLDPAQMNEEDRTILSGWRENGFISGGISSHSLGVTKEFWDLMSECIWLAYVPQNCEGED